jgi:hypothetical protein
MKAEIGAVIQRIVPQHSASEWSKLIIHENLTKRDFEVAAALWYAHLWRVQVYA